MRNWIAKVKNGRCCYRCTAHKLYHLCDNRVKCKKCGCKYSLRKLCDDLTALEFFSLEIPANKAAKHLGWNYRKISNRYRQYRENIFEYLLQEYRKLSGEIECDESYFGGRRKGIRGRGSLGKVKVFGMLERNGRIYTTIVDDVSAETLMREVKTHSRKGSVFYTDKFKSYKSLKFYGKHLEVDHDYTFVEGKQHINGLEGFWSFAKERLQKYHGVNQNYFTLYLKEMEFRYNYRNKNIFELLVQIHFGPENT